MGKNNLKQALLAACLLLVLVFAAYSSSFRAEFVFDDFHQIVRNHNIRSLDNVPAFFTSAKMGSYLQYLKGFRPLTYSSFALNYALSGYDVWSYHLFNLLVHFLTAFLAYLSVRAVLDRAGQGNAHPVALCASLVFAVHPIQTNAVTYVSGRAALLAACFFMLAFYAFLRFRTGGGKTYLWAALSPLFFYIGLLSKEIAVSLLAVMAAYDLIFTVRERGGVSRSMRQWLYYLPFLALLALYLLQKNTLQGYTVLEKLDYGISEYMMSEAKVLLMYVRLMFLPMNQNADYDLAITRSFDPVVLVSWLLAALALVFLYRRRRRDPALAFFGLWFFIAIAPESTLVPIRDIAVEYRLYLPSVGFIAAVVIMAGRALKDPLARKALAVSAVALFALLTFNRNTVWATEYSLWSDVVRKSPYSARGYGNLASALIDMGRYTDAVDTLNTALEVDPMYPRKYGIYNNLGQCYNRMGRKQEAIQAYVKALRILPNYIEPYVNIGAVFADMGQYEKSVDALLRGLKIQPTYVPIRVNLALSMQRLGRGREALVHMQEAVRLSPKDYVVRFNMAAIYAKNGMMGQAMDEANTALSLAGNDEERQRVEKFMARVQERANGGARSTFR